MSTFLTGVRLNHKSPFGLQLRNTTSRMPNACNLTYLSGVIDSVDDSVRTNNDLANVVIPVFRHDATGLGEVLKPICLLDKFISERHCPVRIVARNESDYVVKVVASSGRPD